MCEILSLALLIEAEDMSDGNGTGWDDHTVTSIESTARYKAPCPQKSGV
jgi:hypothetical protein